MSSTRDNFLARAVDWLRAGYPAGVPRQDYVALLGLGLAYAWRRGAQLWLSLLRMTPEPGCWPSAAGGCRSVRKQR